METKLEELIEEKENQLIQKFSPAQLMVYSFLCKDLNIRIKPNTWFEKLLATFLRQGKYFDENILKFRAKQLNLSNLIEIIPYIEFTKNKKLDNSVVITHYYILKKYYPDIKINCAEKTVLDKKKSHLFMLVRKLLNNQIPDQKLIKLAIKETDEIFEVIILKDALRSRKMEKEKIKKIVKEYKILRDKIQETNFLQALNNLYNISTEKTKVLNEEEFKKAISPLSIDEFFDLHRRIFLYSVARLKGNKYGIMRDLIKLNIEKTEMLINCKELDDPEELTEKLSFEIEERVNAVRSIINDFYDKNRELTQIGLLGKVGEILEDKINEYL